jgi:hypothetical protein
MLARLACLLACWLAGSLAYLLACFVCVDLGGCRERWSSRYRLQSGVTRGSARLRRGGQSAESAVRQVRDLAGYAGLSPISRAGCGTVWSGGGKGERMEKRWEQKICSSLRETSGRMKRVERVRDLKMGKRVCPT